MRCSPVQAEIDSLHFNQSVNLSTYLNFLSFMQVTMTPERIREMKATFKECDTDGSGNVSRSEFMKGIQNAGMQHLSIYFFV